MSHITAEFPPRRMVHPQLAQTSPLISSALQRSFALIVIANASVDLVTWTGRDPAMTAVYWATVYLAVYYYQQAVYWFLLAPLLVLGYCSVNYYVNSVYVDINGQENPTLEEILNSLDNLVTKLEMMTAPLRSFRLTWWKFANYVLIMTPLNVLLLKCVLTTRTYVLLSVILMSTYHSLWFQATLRVIWRSLFVRNAWDFFIGTQTLSNNSNNYTILNGNKHGKIIQFQISEHQRRWLGIGWSDKLLPYERGNFTNEAFQTTLSPKEFTFPFNAKHWKWLEEQWKVDVEFCKNKSKEGWVYYDNYWQMPQYCDGITVFTRTRKWTRKAVLVTEKNK